METETITQNSLGPGGVLSEELLLETRRFAHDLRAPLLALKSYLQDRRRQGVLEASTSETHNSVDKLIHESAKRLVQMSESFLANCREEPSLQRSHFQEEEFQQISVLSFRQCVKRQLQQAKAAYKMKAQEQKINISYRDFIPLQIRTELGAMSETSWVRIQPIELERMISNLFMNALESVPTDRNAELLVSTYLDNNKLCLEIQDNGEGMTQQTLHEALEGKSHKTLGNGLGLSQAQRSLRKWQARLNINSVLKKGTAVVLSFPVSSESLQ